MFGLRQSTSSRWAAIVAAYLLVLHAVFAGMSAGAHAGNSNRVATLAMTLCTQGEWSDASRDISEDRHDRMAWCVIGCISSGGGDPEARGAYLPIEHRVIGLSAFARRFDAPHVPIAGRSQANPRAPPSEI